MTDSRKSAPARSSSATRPRALRAPRPVPLICMGLLGLMATAAQADDIVVVSRAEGGTETRRSGEILDYTGEWLTLQVPDGRQERIAATRVLSFETRRVPDHERADQYYSEGRDEDAASHYRRALEQESRHWVQRLILAQLTRCYRNLEQPDRAGEAFLTLLRSDPRTPWYDAIPLAWKSRQLSAESTRQATQWLANTQSPTAQLVGASWLLGTSQREAALETLRRLTSSDEPRVAQLAETQRWRVAIVTATEEDVQRWERHVEQLEAALRAGPSFILGQALARLNQHERAALSFLRVPVLFADERELVAESLWAAGEQLEKQGDPGGARTLYRELIDGHPRHALVPVAQRRLDELPPK